MHKFKKQFGQNFLRSGRFPAKVVEYLNLEDSNTIVEVGPGEGILTNLVLQSGLNTISVEIDYSLLPKLIKRFSDLENFNLVNEDFLSVDLAMLLEKYNAGNTIKFTGSLPYNISKKIILKILKFHFSQDKYKVAKMSFIVQEEVAADYASKPPKASALSNLTRLYADVRKMESIPKSQFFPVPQVNGGILVLEPKDKLPSNISELEQLIKIGYISPRKTLYNNIKNSRKWQDKDIFAIFKQLNIPEKARPSEIDLDLWNSLLELLNSAEFLS